jgi:uncharacterized protein (DUF697 family)
MHDIDRTLGEVDPETDEFESDEFEFEEEFEFESEFDGETDLESPFEEFEEMEFAAELLSIQSEEELDQFLGKLIKKAWRGVRKIGGKIIKPLGGALKGLAKKALPFVGGALGSFIPIPGVGTAVGSALGSAVSKALEMEFEGMDAEDQEFEMAKRFVRVAGAAAKQAAVAGANGDPRAAVKSAVVAAARRHVPGLNGARQGGLGGSMGRGQGGGLSSGGSFGGRQGRWIRRGRKIILIGV